MYINVFAAVDPDVVIELMLREYDAVIKAVLVEIGDEFALGICL